MDLSTIEDKQRNIAIETFQNALHGEYELFQADEKQCISAAYEYVLTLRTLHERSAKMNALADLILHFGGTSNIQVEFDFVEITKDNLTSLLDMLDRVHNDESLDTVAPGIISSSSDSAETNTKTPRKRGIKKRVIKLFAASSTAISTGDVVDIIRSEFGDNTPYQSISNTLLRLQRDGVLVRDSNGNWELVRNYDEDGNRIASAFEIFADDLEDDEQDEYEEEPKKGTRIVPASQLGLIES